MRQLKTVPTRSLPKEGTLQLQGRSSALLYSTAVRWQLCSLVLYNADQRDDLLQ